MIRKLRYRVIVFRWMPTPEWTDIERQNFEINLAENLNGYAEEGFHVVAVTPIDDTLVYTLECKP